MPDGLGHEPGEERVVVAAGEVVAERVEELVAFARRRIVEPGALSYAMTRPIDGVPERRAEGDPPAQRVTQDGDRPPVAAASASATAARSSSSRADRRRPAPSPEAPRPRRSMAWIACAWREQRPERRATSGGRQRSRGRGAAGRPGRRIPVRTNTAIARPVGRRGRRPRRARTGSVSGMAGSVARALGRQAPGRRTANRAPGCPAARFDAWIEPPWRSAIQRAIARPRPVPPLGASGARQNRSNTCSRCAGVDPRSLVLDAQPRPGPDRDRHPAARRRVADRVVDQDRRQLAQPRLVAADGRGHDVQHQPDAAMPRPRAPATRSPRPRRARGPCRPSRASTASASVRASSSRSSTR